MKTCLEYLGSSQILARCEASSALQRTKGLLDSSLNWLQVFFFSGSCSTLFGQFIGLSRKKPGQQQCLNNFFPIVHSLSTQKRKNSLFIPSFCCSRGHGVVHTGSACGARLPGLNYSDVQRFFIVSGVWRWERNRVGHQKKT